MGLAGALDLGAHHLDEPLLEAREVPLGGLRAITVRRTLPHRERSFVGAWCFVDHYGPQEVAADGAGGMDVPPHPHTGLQTVSWLFEGEIEHRDSGGVVGGVRPGEVNLMTAGAGICHSEVTTADTSVLHGVQLWVALPDADRETVRGFEHHAPERVALPEGADSSDAREQVMAAVRAHFRPEFLNRVDDVIVFPQLQKHEIVEIVDLFVSRLGKRLAEQDLSIELTQSAKELLADRGYDPAMGARPLRRTIQQMVEDQLSEKILFGDIAPGQIVLVDVENWDGEGDGDTGPAPDLFEDE